MKTPIGFLVIAFLVIAFLVPALVNAQFTDPLAPSCNSQKKKVLDIPKIPQGDTSWCWVAAAQSVMGFHKPEFAPPTTSLCQMAKEVLEAWEPATSWPCCDMPVNTCMKESGVPEDVFNIPFYHFSYDPLSEQSTKLNWTQATDQICQDRPYIAFVRYLFGTSATDHFVVVYGYWIRKVIDMESGHLFGKREFQVYDPIEGDLALVTYDAFYSPTPDYEHWGDTFGIQPQL